MMRMMWGRGMSCSSSSRRLMPRLESGPSMLTSLSCKQAPTRLTL